MKHLDLDETNIDLTVIINEIAANQSEIVITRQGLPVARIIPYTISDAPTKNYPLRGMPIKIAADFDEPMPELWDALGK
ncbi:type II toxin-antitoxin system Phd/YefM family antitoxin [Okeania sp.]|uniref:type II toxin-antitoxin system Phd/YefM family antitoxin n=1 Tax=Okeania sp. TaxID=3100323 RepID=UPI002B4B3D62|nr:type II toxin-antitoxin system Phd/YefM family antitoxin [Okeania sp.]MEB3343253.1 type II toxin-antitoxin system Phd/YefM family antitoxin [Okeania sp.]